MQEKRPTVSILTQGCKVNQYESEAIAERFERSGFLVQGGNALSDVYVVNTCTVTAESDRKAGQLIRRLHLKNPAAYILVIGCFSQVSPNTVAAISGVDYISGNTDKARVVEVALALLQGGKKPDTPTLAVDSIKGAAFEPMQITKFDRTRAYVKIEDGCENHCAYCTIPLARGNVRSKAPADILTEVEGLVRNGCREVVLTGIETASFGRDLCGYTLADLLEAVDTIPGIGRVRLGSLDPSLMRPDFVARIARLRALTPHFHISMQSGSSRILAAMKRKYNRDMALSGIYRLREAMPAVELTTDFIVGFPGETDADFADTLSFAREAEFLQMHVFAYSKRAGTVAAAMPDQIPTAIKKDRSAALIALGRDLRAARLQKALDTSTREVLFETYENGYAIGHTAEFFEVAAKSPIPLHSELRLVRLTGSTGDRLIGEISL